MTLIIKITTGAGRPGDLSQFVPRDVEAGLGVRFVMDDPSVVEADAWIVLGLLEATGDSFCVVPPGRFVYAEPETTWPEGFFEHPSRVAFLRQFDAVHSWVDLDLDNAVRCPPLLPWMLNANSQGLFVPHPRDHAFLAALEPSEKPRAISMVVSAKAITPAHRQRLRFAELLMGELGGRLDWYGSGIREVEEKWDAVAPYAFHVAMENRIAPGVYSEKLTDAILAWSIPIYWGAPDIERYFDTDGMVLIDATDPSGAIRAVRDALDEGVTPRRLAGLRRAREAALGEQSFVARIHRIVSEVVTDAPPKPRVERRLAVVGVPNTVGYKDLNRDPALPRRGPRSRLGSALGRILSGGGA